MDLSKLIDWIKLSLSPTYALVISIVLGFLLFAPINVLDSLGVVALVAQYRAILGIVFLFSTFLVIVEACKIIFHWIREPLTNRWAVKHGQDRLRNLTEPEKEILRSFVIQKTRSRKLDMSNGVVNALESEQIIFRSSNLGRSGFGLVVFAYNIQPWAWDYLNSHPDLLSPNSSESTSS